MTIADALLAGHYGRDFDSIMDSAEAFATRVDWRCSDAPVYHFGAQDSVSMRQVSAAALEMEEADRGPSDWSVYQQEIRRDFFKFYRS